MFIIVKEGAVQRFHRNGELWWPVFYTLEDAERFGKVFDCQDSPSEIGSVEGESLESHVKLALADGCVGACNPLSWNDDGMPALAELLFD